MEAPYFTCHNLSASYDGSQILFKGLTFAIHPGERWGIIGPNGAGKSTIFKIIQGELKPVEGTISLRNQIRVAFITQKIIFNESLTVEEILRQALPFEYDTDARTEKVEKELEDHFKIYETDPSCYENEKWVEKCNVLNEALSQISGAPTNNIIQSALKVGQLIELKDNEFQNLSGGQQKRVQIISALLKNPNLIFLDEPTNHLDIQTVEWLEEFLLEVAEQGFSLFGFKANENEVEPVSFVIISHDRALLDTLVNKILEVEDNEAKIYQGNYEDYNQQKLELISTNEKTRMKLANTLRRELEWLRSGTKARTTKQSARIERTKALDAHVQVKDKKASQNKKADMTFSANMVSQYRDANDSILTKHHNLGEQELVRLKSVTLDHPGNFQGRFIFKNLNLILKPRSRIAILGPNGCGKSTLLNFIAQKTNPQSGEIKFHDLTHISYFDQKRNNLDYSETIRTSILPEGDHVFFGGKYIHIMSYLERYLFSKSDTNRPISDLSGGEQARLLLAKLMLEQGNVLILDEPTNDLDISTLQVLERNLIEFNGGILFTSHDRYFIQRVATSILTYLGEKNNCGVWEMFPDLNQALDHIEKFKSEKSSVNFVKNNSQEKIQDQKKLDEPQKINSVENSSAEQEKRTKKLSFKEQKEFDLLEKRIFEIEELLSKLTEQLNDSYQNLNLKNQDEIKKLNEKIALLQKELTSSYAKWEILMGV